MQTLDDYVDDIIADSTTPTPRKILVLSRAHIDKFTQMIGLSEGRIVEYGTNLYWRNAQLLPGPTASSREVLSRLPLSSRLDACSQKNGMC